MNFFGNNNQEPEVLTQWEQDMADDYQEALEYERLADGGFFTKLLRFLVERLP